PPTAGPSLIDGLDLTIEQARRIDEFYASLQTRDAFELLEVTRGADKKDIKRAYFKLSKELHPDRFFGKNIGPYRERLSKIFQSVKAAYELLMNDSRRAAYLDSVK
ncbi:MAG TPA: J domain-containing protein, partial [Polyangia bacterium]